MFSFLGLHIYGSVLDWYKGCARLKTHIFLLTILSFLREVSLPIYIKLV